MGKRVLSAEEAEALGLGTPAPKRRVLAPDEAAALGLESAPVSPGDLAHLDEGPPRDTSFEGKGMSLSRGIQQGGTAGMADEIGARISSIPGVGRYLNTPLNDLVQGKIHKAQNYDEALAEIRGDVFKKSERDNPGLALGGEVLGSMALPGPGKGKVGAKLLERLARNVATNAGVGAAYGYGKSEGKDTLKDTGVSAGVSALAGLLPFGIGEAGRALAGRATRGVGKALEDALQASASKADDAIRSKTGALGGETQAGSRDIEVMIREAADLPEGHPLKAKLLAFLGSDDALKLREGVASNKLESAPGRLGAANTLRAELDALKAGRGEAVTKGAEELLANPIRKQVLPRAKLLGNRFIPPVLGAIAGAALGDEGGAAVGTGLGTAMSLIQGRPGTVVRNMVHSPGFRKMAWGALDSGGEALTHAGKIPGALAAILANALSEPNEQEALAEALRQRKSP